MKFTKNIDKIRYAVKINELILNQNVDDSWPPGDRFSLLTSSSPVPTPHEPGDGFSLHLSQMSISECTSRLSEQLVPASCTDQVKLNKEEIARLVVNVMKVSIS